MVTDFFGSLLQDLGKVLNIPNLHPDTNNSCLVKFKGGVTVQFEIDREGQYFIIGTDLGVIPIGRYRENIFTEALRANALPGTRHGIFAYSKQKDHLVLFEMMPIKDLHVQKVADFLTPFLAKATAWKEAITRGEIPVLPSSDAGRKSSNIFGIK